MPIIEHPIHIVPEKDLILWRYMSFDKYVSLLTDRALFFCRADKFSDPFECSIPIREVDYRSSEHRFQMAERAFGRYDSVFNEAHVRKQSKDMALAHQKVKTATTVNCWHINNSESDAMWQLYLKDNEGVAVKTTIDRLHKALSNCTQNLGISKVRYLDYENDTWFHERDFPIDGYNMLTPIVHKRRELQHECELRIYHHDYHREKVGFWDTAINSVGELVSVDGPTLVESVIFHPTADELVKKKIIDTTIAVGCTFNFEESKMRRDPTY